MQPPYPSPDPTGYEPGYDIPALPGWPVQQVHTPALLIDLDALERNLATMRAACADMGVSLRAHGKMHRSADLARLQMTVGGAVGLCCQKVSEAEAFVRAGLRDVLISNELRDPAKLDRLARLPLLGARVAVCVDDAAAIAPLAEACARHGTQIEVLIEIDCGAGRCGIAPDAVVPLAQTIVSAGLNLTGVQAYHGKIQHIRDFTARQAEAARAEALTRHAVGLLRDAGFAIATVTGGGSGSFGFEGTSGLWTELQCGSYAVMDADYAAVRDAEGQPLSARFTPALQVLTQVMSLPRPGHAVCDAGLKSLSGESGLPLAEGLTCLGLSDEHSEFADPDHRLKVGDRLRLIPGHCDPTINLHDWLVGLRGDRVECLWPVTARGRSF